MTQDNFEIRDGRQDLPVFIHSELDDLELTTNAFRVYCHLARRAGQNGEAWPSYASIGKVCLQATYPKSSPDTWRRRAMEAVQELVDRGLVRKVANCGDDGAHNSNRYILTPRSEWRGGGAIAPKGTPCEGSPLESV